MIEFKAQFFDGQSSQPYNVIVKVDGQGSWSIHPQTTEQQPPAFPQHTSLADISISRRLGSTPRRINYPDGQILVVKDNDTVDGIIRAHGTVNWLNKIVSLLESKLRYIALLFLAAIGLIALFKFVIIPAASIRIAHQMPQSMVTKIGEQSFSNIEGFLFEPSKLTDDTKTRIKNHFQPLLNQFPHIELNVEFRDSHIGPNALAFPHGTIVFTDDLVDLSEHDDELLSIFAHEIGHVYHRHSMQNVVHQSSLSVLTTLVFGGAGNGLAGGVSDTVMHGSYSRDFETEADDFSLHYAEHELFDPIHFSNIMQRMVERAGIECERKGNQVICGTEEGNMLDGFLSTHPVSEVRIQRFLDLHFAQKAE